MPTYEYKCDSCGEEFEQFQSITAKPLRKCPNCGRNSLNRLIGRGAGIIFKGSGFYQTDYRSESYRNAEKKEKESGKEKKGEDKSRSKKQKESTAKLPTKSEGDSGSKADT